MFKANGAADMENQNGISGRKIFLFIAVVLVLVVLIALFWKPYVPPYPPEIKGTPPAAKEVPPTPVKENKVVLESGLAGRWYPADANVLAKQVAELFGKTDSSSDKITALILPHAGYQYSGASLRRVCKVPVKNISELS